MSSANERNNIVDLTQRGNRDPRNERVGELLASVRSIGQRHLKELVGNAFDNVDDALFDLAEKAENNAVQTQYFDGMRDVRKRRTVVERKFADMINNSFAELAAGLRRKQDEAHADGRPQENTHELSLVDEHDLEESLAVTSMASKAESRHAHSLFALNQRMTVICGGTSVGNADNPVGPAPLSYAFGEAMSHLEVEVRVKLIVFKLFERYVLGMLEPLYDEINRSLAEAGVLPQLRGSGNRRPSDGRQKRADADATDAAADMESYEDDDAERAALRTRLVETLQSLLAKRRHDSGLYASQTGTSLSPAELLGALSVLQVEVARNTAAMPSQIPVDTTLSAEEVRLLKNQLVRQLNHLRGETKSQVSGADEDTIDLVSMLFEYILQDHNLPMEMQVLLARLQIPYLKAAILDRRLFAHAKHPARRLLDELAEAAKGWSPEADRDLRLLKKVRSVVETLLDDFDDDMEVFGQQLEDFRTFLESSNRRAQLAEQRAAEATRGREKLQHARRRAAKEILTRIENQELPPLVNGILTRAWANYLVLTLLRHGDESKEFRAALRFVDDFVWSVGPIQAREDRERLRQILPSLEKALRHGLATVAFQDSDVESLMRQLNALYNSQLGQQQNALAQEPQDENEPMPIPESMEAIAAPEILEEAQTPPPENPVPEDGPEIQRVRTLKVGTWVEFKADSERPERAKLSWISPISGKYLFVNRRGLKVADKTLEQFAAELASGETVVLEELPLFDRALDAIVERLRSSQGNTGTQDQPSENPAS